MALNPLHARLSGGFPPPLSYGCPTGSGTIPSPKPPTPDDDRRSAVIALALTLVERHALPASRAFALAKDFWSEAFDYASPTSTDGFVECDTCRAKLGSPVLCVGCRANRALIAKLQATSSRPTGPGVAPTAARLDTLLGNHDVLLTLRSGEYQLRITGLLGAPVVATRKSLSAVVAAAVEAIADDEPTQEFGDLNTTAARPKAPGPLQQLADLLATSDVRLHRGDKLFSLYLPHPTCTTFTSKDLSTVIRNANAARKASSS